MIPNIFVSSTVQDLQYLRDAIRDQIIDIGYNPIMSDYGEIGYLPITSAENSCYLSMKECQITVLLIGKKYSGLATDSLSVTHNEYLVAKKNMIPVICLIDKDVLAYKKVHEHQKDINDSLLASFPEMDNPEKTFELINDFKDSNVNNGYLPFSNSGDAMHHLKSQLAHIFGQMLRDRFDPLSGTVKDVLSEIKALKHEFLKGRERTADYEPFLRGIRLVLDDENQILHTLMIIIFDNLEEGVANILNNEDIVGLVEKSGFSINLLDLSKPSGINYDVHFESEYTSTENGKDEVKRSSISVDTKNREIYLNQNSLSLLTEIFDKIKLITKACENNKFR